MYKERIICSCGIVFSYTPKNNKRRKRRFCDFCIQEHRKNTCSNYYKKTRIKVKNDEEIVLHGED